MDVNPWGPGWGTDVGYTLPVDAYVGGNLAPGAEVVVLTGAVALSADVRYDMIFLDSMTANALIVGAGIGF